MTSLGIDIGGTSVKLAAVRGTEVLWTSRGAPYRRPTAEQLIGAIREAATGRTADLSAVGLCVPGLLDDDRLAVKHSVNVPGLNGLPLNDLVTSALGARPPSLIVITDANATALDIHALRHLTGRLFVLAVGAGVGASVVDNGRPLSVDGDSPGHFGQMDVSVERENVVGPDGGAGSLEGYLSAAALAQRYRPADGAWIESLRPDDPPMRAMVKAIRIAHAIYRPHHVCLAGGIGLRLGHLLAELRRGIDHQLTNIARPGWTLTVADSDFHAAQGAARFAIIGQAAGAAQRSPGSN